MKEHPTQQLRVFELGLFFLILGPVTMGTCFVVMRSGHMQAKYFGDWVRSGYAFGFIAFVLMPFGRKGKRLSLMTLALVEMLSWFIFTMAALY